MRNYTIRVWVPQLDEYVSVTVEAESLRMAYFILDNIGHTLKNSAIITDIK